MTRCLGIACGLVAGCYPGWRPVDEQTPITPHDRVLIWTQGRVEEWHWVVVTQDSVSGVPWTSPWCTTCRRSIPRTQVDSMKLGFRTHAQNITRFAGAVVGALVVDAALCAVLAPHDRDC